jgi:hypothetical protein
VSCSSMRTAVVVPVADETATARGCRRRQHNSPERRVAACTSGSQSRQNVRSSTSVKACRLWSF